MIIKAIMIICLANTGGAKNVSSILYFDSLQECRESLKLTKIETSPVKDTSNTWMGFASCGYLPNMDKTEPVCSNYGSKLNKE